MIEPPCSISIEVVDLAKARSIALEGIESAVGHADTAAIFSSELRVPVITNRATVSLKKGDVVLIGQYRGPRLPEGATILPDGATIQWFLVTVC